MKIQSISINIYLLLVSVILLAGRTAEAGDPKAKAEPKPKAAKEPAKRKPKKEFATIRFHLETNLDGTPKTKIVPIYRANPVNIAVEELVFLDEGSVERAAVVDWGGSFVIRLQLNHH